MAVVADGPDEDAGSARPPSMRPTDGLVLGDGDDDDEMAGGYGASSSSDTISGVRGGDLGAEVGRSGGRGSGRP